MKPRILLLVVAVGSYGQQIKEPPKYEVASIKPAADSGPDYSFHIGPDGSLSAAGITLRRLMMTAYNVQGFRILGGPEWVSSRRWEVQARPDRRPASPDETRGMLRALLEERFSLQTHVEIRELPVYELVVDGKGSKVPRAKGREATVQVSPGSIRLTDAASATFASQLSYALAKPVIDKTGLAGKFDFAFEWTPEAGEDGGPTTDGRPPAVPEPSSPDGEGPSIFTAIREQLGLRLMSARGPLEVVTIDSVQMPTGN